MAENNIPPELSEAMKQLADAMRENAEAMGRSTKAADGSADSQRKMRDATNASIDRTTVRTRQEELAAEAIEKYNEAKARERLAVNQSIDAVKSLGNALLTTEKNFAKYGRTLDSVGDAALNLGKNFGILGTAIGATIKGMTMLANAAFQQTDNVLKANDQLSKMGGAGGQTAKELLEMGHRAGLTSKNLDVMMKPLQSLGSRMMILGDNADESIKAFGNMNAVSKEQRMAMQRLGVSQEELMQNTADYVALQSAAGANLRAEMKDRDALKRASLEYTENLLVLAKVSGEDVETVKKRQAEAARSVEWQISQIQLENKARKAESEGRTEEAAAFRKQAKDQRAVLDSISSFGNEVVTKGARQFLATGAVSQEEGAALTRMGLMEDLQKLRNAIQKGGDVQKAQAEFQDAYNKKFGQTIENVGVAAQYSKEAASAFGISEQALENYNKRRDQNVQKEDEAARAKIAAAQQPGKDPAQDARAKLAETERSAQVALDKLVLATNPLMQGFNVTTIAATGLATAAGIAAAALTAMAGKAALGKVGSMLPGKAAGATEAAKGAASTAAKATGTLAKLATPLASASKAVPVAGAVIGAGLAAKGAYDEYQDIEQKRKAGEITEKEAKEKKTEAVGGGVGSAAGAAGGAWAGAAAGAAIGSVVPVVGTLIGGALGAALGGWLGSKGGEAVGKVAATGISKMSDTADKKTAEAAKKVEEKKPVEADKKVEDKKTTEEKKVEPNKPKAPIEQPSMLPAMAAATAASPESRIEDVRKMAEERLAKHAEGKIKTEQDGLKTVNDSLRQFQQMLDISNKSLANLTINFTKFDSLIKGTLDEVSPEDATKEVKDQIKGVLGSALIDIGKIRSQLKDTQASAVAGAVPPPGAVTSGTGGAVTDGSGKPIMSGMPPSMPAAPPPMKQDVKENLGGIAEALKKRGMTDQNYINAVLGNVMKESGGKVTNENLNYSKTSNERIRSIFKSATAGKTDEEITEMKSSPEKMAEAVYGSGTKLGKGMGNSEPGDGWKFRGRGYIQLTGKNNYAAASKAIFGDDRLIENPDLVNDPKIASEVVAWYMQKGQSSMAGKLGLDAKGGMSAEQAQLLATSQIAGTAIKPGQGYLGGEVLQKVAMYSAKMPSAGGRDERVMQASGGLIADGPETGYPVEHHGLEITAPLDTESILMKLAKTQAESNEGKEMMSQVTGSKSESGSDMSKEIIASNMEIYGMMASKLDQVIAQLSDGNETSNKLLKHSLV